MTRFFLVACAVSFIGKAVGITHESTKKLKDTLLQDYDSLVPPIPSDGKPVSVRLGVVVISFRRDDLKGEAIWHLWLRSVSSDTFTSFTKAHLPSGFGIRWNLSVFPPVEAMLTWLKSHPGEHPPGSRRTCANDQVDFHWVGHPPGFKSTSYPPGLSARWMQKWNDERLMWEPSDHSNISTLRMPSDKVWIPDITPYNEASEDEFDSSLHQQLSSHTLVYSNGEVLFVPNLVLKTYCQGDLTHWPLDRQVCGITFGSWFYDGNLVNLSLYGSPEDALNMVDYRESTDWTVVGTPTMTREEEFYFCWDGPYIKLQANVTFSRKPSVFYHTALFFPVIGTALLTLAAQWYPAGSTHRVMYFYFNFFVLLVLQFYHSAFIPMTGASDIKILTFMRIMMCLQVIGLIWSLLTLLIASTHNGVTSKLAQLSQTALGKVFCLFTEIPEELLEGEGKGTSARTEILVMNFLDRICFYVFLFTIAINFAVNWPHRQ